MPYALEIFFKPLRDTHAQMAIWAVLALMLLDLVVGIVCAVMTRRFSSLKMRDGLLHKFAELACVAMAVIFDGLLIGGFDITNQPILIATCSYIIIAEAGSVLELVKTYNPNVSWPVLGFLTTFVTPKGGELTPAQNVIIESTASDPDDTADLGRHLRGE